MLRRVVEGVSIPQLSADSAMRFGLAFRAELACANGVVVPKEVMCETLALVGSVTDPRIFGFSKPHVRVVRGSINTEL